MRSTRFAAILTIFALTTVHADDTLDLPIMPPRQGEALEFPEGIPLPPPVVEDPSDTPPPVFFGEDIPSDSDTVVYVLDRSASMNAAMPYPIPPFLLMHFGQRLSNNTFLSQAWSTRWAIARMECLKSVRALAENFEFNVIVYDCDPRQWSPSPRRAMPDAKAELTHWLVTGEGSFLGGGTGTGPAVAKALAWKENLLVILLTDGDPNCPKAEDGQLYSRHELHQRIIRAANTQGARIDVFFIHTGVPYHREFCQKVARENRGQFRSIHAGGEVRH